MLHSQKADFKRYLMMIISLVVIFVQATFSFAETIPAAEVRNPMVRVCLRRLGITDRMDVTINTPYALLGKDGVQVYFHPGSQFTFMLKDGQLYLYYQGMSLLLGQDAQLLRTRQEEKSGFYLTNFPALYMGDLTLQVVEGAIRPILSIHVEDYLLGVVPYEMSDAFPLEALKAQAIAARTYAMRSQNPNADYDVVDTTNDQVFKGYVEGFANAEQAVRETDGICGFYKGKLAQCYYSASNGGQTELVESVWPAREAFGYYAFGEDPYDVENPLSTVRSFEIPKNKSESSPFALRKLLADTLGEWLQQRGYDPSPESIRIDGVHSVYVDSPAVPQSKLMTMLHMTLSISARSRQNVLIQIVDQDTEEVTLFEAETLQNNPLASEKTAMPSSGFVPVITTVPSATPAPLYGPFERIEEVVSLSLPVFPDAESAFGMDISSNYDNEIWSVAETEDTFRVEARRYGHGVGMSQRGAQWMAGAHGMSYLDILNFYYPGMELMKYPSVPAEYMDIAEPFSATAGPAPSPTPRPTAVPLTVKAAEGEWYAAVTEIDADSSLNLRSEPGLNGKIITRLYKNQRLLVQERCLEEGWVKVRTDVYEGYVMEKFLTNEE